MALNITKGYTPSSGAIADSSLYNTDLAALFNAFSGLEAQTSSLGALHITPGTDDTDLFRVNNSGAEAVFTVDVTNEDIIVADTAKIFFDGNTSGAGDNTYLHEVSADNLQAIAGGVTVLDITSTGLVYNEASADIDFRFEGNGNANLLYGDAGNDRIGIGTSTPDSLLQIFRDTAGSVSAPTAALLNIEGGSAAVGMSILSAADGVGIIYLGDVDDNDVCAIQYLHGTNQLQFVVNATTQAAIDSNGYINSLAGITCGSATYDSTYHIDNATNGADTGTMYIGNNTIDVTAPSDESVKKDVFDKEDVLVKLKSIKVKKFKYKQDKVSDGDSEHTGMLAQEVETIFPEAVYERSDGLKAINYKLLIPYIIKAIQEIA